jgi:transcriptional regulator with XRE-family HTH domain
LDNITHERIKTLIRQNKTTARQVLNDLGLNAGFFTDMKRRGTSVSSDTMIKFADYFNVSVDYLLGNTMPVRQKKEPLHEAEAVQRINQTLIEKGWKLPGGQMSDVQLNTLIGFISDNAETLRKIVEQNS